MNRKFRVLWFILLFCGLTICRAERQVSRGDNVLIINSYSPLKEKGNHLIAAFVEELNQNMNVSVDVEYLDCESIQQISAWCDWMTSLFRAYKMPPKVIVIIGNEAWMAYRHCYIEAWKDIPIVLGGIKEGVIDYWGKKVDDVREILPTKSTFGELKVTGHYTVDYIEENIRLIKRLQPEVKHILFYYDDRYRQHFLESYLQSIIERIGDLKLHYFKGSKMSTLQLLDSIASYKDGSALISAGWYTDVNHYLHASSMLHSELVRHGNRFIYEIFDQDFSDHHNLGGYFITGKELGKDLAGLTYKVLKDGIGQDPEFDLIPIKPRYHLNYETFTAFQLSKSRLPEGVVWYNLPSTLWEKHAEIVILLVLLLISILVITLLALHNRRRREKEYIRSTHLLESMPEMAIIYDRHLTIVDIVNPLKDSSLPLSREMVLNKNIREVANLVPDFKGAVEVVEKNVASAFREQKTLSFSYGVKINGKEWYAEAKAIPFEKDKVICFSHDVTPRVEAEKEVLKLKTFLQSIIDNLPVGLFVKNVSDDFRYIFFNRKTVEFYHNETEIILGKNDFEIDDPKATQYWEEDMDALKSDTPITYDRRVYDQEGGLLHSGLLTKTRMLNSDGSYYLVGIIVDMTEIRKSEIELGNVRNELSIALDAGSLSVWVFNVQSQMFGSLYNKTVHDGLNFEQVCTILHPDDNERYKQFIEKLITGEREKDSIVLRAQIKGEYRWYEIHAIGIRSANNSLIYQIVGTEKDISDEIVKQQELEESKFKLEMAFVAADMVPWDYNVEEDLFYSGSEKSVFLNKKLNLSDYLDLVHPDYREKFELELHRVIHREIEAMDMVIYTSSLAGNYEWTQLMAKAMGEGKNGEALKVVGTRKYITEAVEAEQKLKDYIFKSDLVIKSGGIVQWDYDVDTHIFSSPNPDSFMHDGISDNDFYISVFESDIAIVKDALQKLLGGEVETITIQIRVKLQNKDYRWVEIHGVAFQREENGRLRKITGLRRDITDWRNMTDELILLRDKAEESNRLKTAFLANMSHEIRTPLNAIVGFSNLIAQTSDPDSIQEFCRIIETNNELLLQLINDILDLSKIEAGRLEFVYTDLDVSSIFSDLEQIYHYRVKSGVELICELPDKNYMIHSEKNRLTQVVSNFLSNACKFTSKGSIRMGYERVEDGLRFYVTDTGKGIAPENVTKVFERFTKFDSFVQGTGLGLSICEMIVSRLKGEIGVDSELGMGSTFWFFIPCTVKEQGSEKLDVLFQKPEMLSKVEDAEKKLILVAEDNDSNFLLLSSILKKNYDLVQAKDGKEAVLLYKEKHPQLILMDVKMPEMDGLEATKEIRKIDKKVPIIALTAYAFDEDRERAAEAGCDGFLTKPINVKMLRDLLIQLFES